MRLDVSLSFSLSDTSIGHFIQSSSFMCRARARCINLAYENKKTKTNRMKKYTRRLRIALLPSGLHWQTPDSSHGRLITQNFSFSLIPSYYVRAATRYQSDNSFSLFFSFFHLQTITHARVKCFPNALCNARCAKRNERFLNYSFPISFLYSAILWDCSSRTYSWLNSTRAKESSKNVCRRTSDDGT